MLADEPLKRQRYKRIDEDNTAGLLGKGTFGRVYIAEDALTGDVVAVKRQKFPSAEAAKELAFAKMLVSNPSDNVVAMKDCFCDSCGTSASSQRCGTMSSASRLVFEYMDTTLWHEVARRSGLQWRA